MLRPYNDFNRVPK